MTGKDAAHEAYKRLLKEEPNEAMAVSVAASLADLAGEEMWRFCFFIVSLVRTPEMPHEDSGLREQEKTMRLMKLNYLLSKLPAFTTAMERMHEAVRPLDAGGSKPEG